MNLKTGKLLNSKYELKASHALYRRDGKWFHHLLRFPGVLCDEFGYVKFETRADYLQHPGLQHGQNLHVPDGISTFSSYVKFEEI